MTYNVSSGKLNPTTILYHTCGSQHSRS